MAKYVYVAIFTPEENGMYSIRFPDVDGAYTCGDNLADGIDMAEDVLALALYKYETEGREIPAVSSPSDFSLSEGEFTNYISCDTLQYQKMYNNKSVKKTLTIPEWLNEAAVEVNINFSQVLQEALKEKLNLA